VLTSGDLDGSGSGEGGVGEVDTVGVSLTGDKVLPGLVALTDDILGVLLVLALTGESKLVLLLSVRDLVDTEPLVGGSEKTGETLLDILNVVELGSKGIVNVNDNHLPVGLTLIKKGHDTEDLDLLDLTSVADSLTNLANIKRIVITLGLGLGMDRVGVLPGLGESTVVVNVTVVGEAVADKSELTLLGVLENGVQGLLLGDLELGVSPTGDLDDKVKNGLLGVGIERNVVEGGDDLSSGVLDEHAVLKGVGSTNLTNRVRGRHDCGLGG